MTCLSASDAGGQNVCAFLDMIAYSELGPMRDMPVCDDGYNVIVGSTPTRLILFSNYTDHPRVAVKTPWGFSDAAGRYQIMAAIKGLIHTNTWDWVSQNIKAADFNPETQDRAAIRLLEFRGVLGLVRAGKFADAVEKCRKEWASLPGAGYGQHENVLATLQKQYINAGGQLA